ncbi:kinase-like protein [Ramaria rubella]|nr:kinase-like protein [Ramaria rubella]
MNFSFDVVGDTEIFEASIVPNQIPLTRRSKDSENIDSLEDYHATLALTFPTVIANIKHHEAPTPLHLLRGLGEGTMGRVFLARDSKTSQIFALKVFNKSYVLACEEQDNVLTERDCLMETCDNPFTVDLRASFQDETRLYMLLEFCAGGDLATELTRWKDGMPMENVMYNAAHLLEGIASLHAIGIVHRDLKPENILLTVRGHIKISDFGSAVRVSSPDDWIEPSTQFGTVAYISPEVHSGGHTSSIDWWSYGVLLYEMIFGKHPFLCDSIHDGELDTEDLTEAICNGEYSLPETVGSSTRKIIRGFLRANPDRRYDAEKARQSAFFSGWEWDVVRQLGYEPPHRPVVYLHDATINFDPEFASMNLEDDSEDLYDQDDSTLAAHVFTAFEFIPNTSGPEDTIPLERTQTGEVSLSNAHEHDSSISTTTTNASLQPSELHTTWNRIPLSRSRLSTVSLGAPTCYVDDDSSLTWSRRSLKECLTAVTRFRRDPQDGDLLQIRTASF